MFNVFSYGNQPEISDVQSHQMAYPCSRFILNLIRPFCYMNDIILLDLITEIVLYYNVSYNVSTIKIGSVPSE